MLTLIRILRRAYYFMSQEEDEKAYGKGISDVTQRQTFMPHNKEQPIAYKQTMHVYVLSPETKG